MLFLKILEWLKATELILEHTNSTKNSSGKDTRKENEKITKPERKTLYQSILFELYVSLLHYFSVVYHIEGFIRCRLVRLPSPCLDGHWVNWWLKGTTHHGHQWPQVNRLYELADKKERNLTCGIGPGQPCSHADWNR